MRHHAKQTIARATHLYDEHYINKQGASSSPASRASRDASRLVCDTLQVMTDQGREASRQRNPFIGSGVWRWRRARARLRWRLALAAGIAGIAGRWRLASGVWRLASGAGRWRLRWRLRGIASEKSRHRLWRLALAASGARGRPRLVVVVAEPAEVVHLATGRRLL